MSDTDFSALLSKETPIAPLKKGQIVRGKVSHVGKKIILVDLQDQFTGIISGRDLVSSIMSAADLKVGDEVEAMFRGQDRDSGLLILSLRKASQVQLIDKLSENLDKGGIMTVVPSEANKGGLLVDLDGMKGFIPVSQLAPMHYPRVEGADPEKILTHLRSLIGKQLKVKVLNVDTAGKKIIFSERATDDSVREAAIKRLKVGEIVEGVVSGILSYGLFITFEGLEGLVHVSEIDWGHVADPSKFAKIGDKTKVQTIGLEPDKISLSIKRLKANPWAELAGKFKVGDIVDVPVIKISKFGIFVEMNGGINGLIHLSEISYKTISDPTEVVQIGKKVKAKIITLDVDEKRVGLSLKALETPPVSEMPVMSAEHAKVDPKKEADLDVEKEVEKPAKKKSEDEVAEAKAESSEKKEAKKPVKKTTKKEDDDAEEKKTSKKPTKKTK